MPRGRTGQEAQDMMERAMFDQYLAEAAHERARDEGTSGRYGAGRPRGHDARGYGDSDRGGPRTAGSRDNYPPNVSGASRGHGGHHAATGGEGYEDSPDFSDDDSLAGESVDPRASGARGSRGVDPRGNRRGTLDELYNPIPSDFQVARPPYEGTRGQRGGHGLPVSRGTGSPYPDPSSDGSSGESTDDEPIHYSHGVRSGASAHQGAGPSQGRRQQLPPHSPGCPNYQGGRSGSVDSVDSEGEVVGRSSGIRQYGGQRAPGSYGRFRY